MLESDRLLEPQPKWSTITKNALFTMKRDGKRNIRAALFIHGFSGNNEATWVNGTSGNSFPGLLFTDPDVSDYDIFGFQYRTNAISGTVIERVAKQLAEEIENRMKRYTHVVLITHSMGGLVGMRYILDRLSRARHTPVSGLLLYGVPISGSYLVMMAKLAGAALNFTVPKSNIFVDLFFRRHRELEQLAPASSFIQELNDEWALRVINGGHPSEDANRRAHLPVRVVTGADDLVVKEVSAKGTYGSIDWHTMDTDHVDLVKPSDSKDRRYLTAKDFLESCRHRVDHFVQKRLREISDSILGAKSEPLCHDWKYRVHIHGGATYPGNDPLLKAGFSRFVVKKCRYRAVLREKSVTFGFAWGNIAAGMGWKQQPVYVHSLFNLEMTAQEKSSLSSVIDKLLDIGDLTKSWNLLMPELTISISQSGRRHELNADEIDRDDFLLVRRFRVPEDLHESVNEEVTFDIAFRSYVPRNANIFTLCFPWLHVRFDGLFTFHRQCERVLVNQFLSGEKKLTILEEPTDNKFQIELSTQDVVLPGGRVEISWVGSNTRQKRGQE